MLDSNAKPITMSFKVPREWQVSGVQVNNNGAINSFTPMPDMPA